MGLFATCVLVACLAGCLSAPDRDSASRPRSRPAQGRRPERGQRALPRRRRRARLPVRPARRGDGRLRSGSIRRSLREPRGPRRQPARLARGTRPVRQHRRRGGAGGDLERVEPGPGHRAPVRHRSPHRRDRDPVRVARVQAGRPGRLAARPVQLGLRLRRVRRQPGRPQLGHRHLRLRARPPGPASRPALLRRARQLPRDDRVPASRLRRARERRAPLPDRVRARRAERVRRRDVLLRSRRLGAQPHARPRDRRRQRVRDRSSSRPSTAAPSGWPSTAAS